MSNRQEGVQGRSRRNLDLTPSDLPDGTAYRPVSVEEGRGLRDEALLVEYESGETVPAENAEYRREDVEIRARPMYRVVNEWRDWFEGYRNAHMEFEAPDGETVRTPLENSSQPEYGKRYYGKIKDWERGVERAYQNPTTAILTLSASSENANGNRRCPADHMRDIADGWKTARKTLHGVLEGFAWEYAKVWEPHQSGYGHLHIGVVVDDPNGAISGETFRPFIRSYVENTAPAGSEAHDLDVVGLGDTASVNDDVENLGTYISEYIGIFGEEPTERPVSEQLFYATTWATGTRRVDFSNGAHEIMAKEQFRRETGLRPEDRGGESYDRWQETGDADGGESGESGVWTARSICTVRNREPHHSDPTSGGESLTRIDGRPGADPPPVRE